MSKHKKIIAVVSSVVIILTMVVTLIVKGLTTKADEPTEDKLSKIVKISTKKSTTTTTEKETTTTETTTEVTSEVTSEPTTTAVVVTEAQPVVQEPIVTEVQPVAQGSTFEYSLSQFMTIGRLNWGGYQYTYYSQSVLSGGALNIPGRHVNANGYVADGDGYIVLANDAPIGTIFPTPFGGPGKVYDRGTSGNHLDVYIQ